MGRRGWAAMVLLQLALFVATAFPPFSPQLGAPVWHHNASLVVAVLLVVPWWRRMVEDRAFLGIGVLTSTFLAIVSGFYLLYDKQNLKLVELKDWLKFWHILWSWWALLFFAGHTWINRAGLVALWHRMHAAARGSGKAWHVFVWVASVVLWPVTWVFTADWWTEANYILWTLWTWLVLLAIPYVWWWVARRSMRRVDAKAWTDTMLFPATILANLSGFPLLYFKDEIHGNGLKYVAKYWHAWPSIAMAVIVVIHSIHQWKAVRRHWDNGGVMPRK
ncbi:MAG: hypothetical protein ACPHK8_01530 [Thermoplasmatota archaeon]